MKGAIIKPLLPGHWQAIKTIYEHGFATGNATFQLAAPATWSQWDKGHLGHSRFVAIINNKVEILRKKPLLKRLFHIDHS